MCKVPVPRTIGVVVDTIESLGPRLPPELGNKVRPRGWREGRVLLVTDAEAPAVGEMDDGRLTFDGVH